MIAAPPPRILAAPLRLRCGLVLANRLVKSAMSEGLATDHMLPTPEHVRLYERWARSGAGLLVTGNVMIDPMRRVARGDVALGDADSVRGTYFRRWVDAASRHGVPLFMQLNHPGRQVPRALDAAPVAPSAVLLDRARAAFAPPRALSPLEISGVVERFARAASVAERAGFAGVEIHAAHGYLLSQFLSPRSNVRRDSWGGNLEARARILLDVVRAIRAVTSPAFALAVKLNSSDFLRGGLDVASSMRIARLLDEAAVDLLEITGGTYESDALLGRRTAAPGRARQGAYFADYVRALRPTTTVPLLLTGGHRRRDVIEDSIAEGVHDLVGLARPLVLCPDLPRRLLSADGAGAPPDLAPLGLRGVDAAMELAWYTAQIRRLAEGKEPAPAASRLYALGRAALAFL